MEKRISIQVGRFVAAAKQGRTLDMGRARRNLIAQAIDNGMTGWSDQAIRLVTDDRGNLLPRNGYESES